MGVEFTNERLAGAARVPVRSPCVRPPSLWGVGLGLCVGGGVVLLSAIRYGLSAPLLFLGVVLAVVFGGLALIAAFARKRTTVD